ncbi:MAG: phosphatidate cytidylyltransferase [Xanthomonadales bacterium]|nr:phosphatidate cytidylyltransferase [Xanthomonadales bacterium]
MLRQRVVTAVILAPIGIATILLIPAEYFWFLLAFILGLVAWEWVQFGGYSSQRIRVPAGLAAAGLIALVLSRSDPGQAVAISAIAVAAWLASLVWFRFRSFSSGSGPASRFFKLGVGLAVIVSCSVALGHLFSFPQGRAWFICLLLLIWSADVGAYFVGKQFGRRKLAPGISPGKTWAGVYGGLAAAAIVSGAAAALFGLRGTALVMLVLVGVATAAVSVLGDLLASLMKRQSGLKDSSALLPGHGGAIDRFDSLMAAAPVFYLGVGWVGH